ncbi:MAG: proton-conducting transporter membrane subunit, partial [Myxococcota bacterium]
LSAAALTAVGVMPVGGLLFLELGLQLLPSAATTFAPMLLWVGATTSFLGGCMALVDRDLRALLAGAALVHGGLALLGLSCLDTKAAVAAILYLVSVSASLAVALFCVDALERRYLTRDSVELFGVLEELPGLWRIVVLSFGSLLAVPMLGGGALAFEVARGVLSTRAFAVAGLPSTLSFLVLLVSGLGATLLAAGVVTVVRRLSSPHARPEVRTRAAFSTSQSLRLWIALVFVWSGSLLAPWLLPSLTEQVERGTIAIEAGDRHVVAEPEARR